MFKRGDVIRITGGRRKDKIGQPGVVKHVAEVLAQSGALPLVWISFDDATPSICFNPKDITKKSALEQLAEQAE